MTQFSPQQDDALRKCAAWLKTPVVSGDIDSQVFRLFGFAGTGKTTLARHLAADVEGPVYFGAYTGKAAHVLMQKGCPGAQTIHSLMYTGADKSRARLKELEAKYKVLVADPNSSAAERRILEEAIEQEKTALSRPNFILNEDSVLRGAALIALDECSMIDEPMGKDILSFGRKVLVMGDPAQLPPVFGEGYFTSMTPTVLLTEIHRQAADNPIIRMATTIREGGKLELGSYGESRVIRASDMRPEIALGADQLLVGKNVTRSAMNDRVRALKGYFTQSPYPLAGDKLVCLRNDKELGVLNGSIWQAYQDCGIEADYLDLHVFDPALCPRDSDEPSVIVCQAHKPHFLGKGKEIPFYEKKDYQEFDYGYALTVHKSQGSQWDEVILFDEWYRDDRRQWLYTGVTRAAERITVVKM